MVSRPRLLQMLREGYQANRKWTLVSAPAGYGKSTLIAEWLHPEDGAGTSFAWLSLDEKDNDPIRFLTYCIAALQKTQPDIGQSTLALLDSFRRPDLETLLTALINEIEAASLHTPDRLVFVLDDYHKIGTEAVHGQIRFLLDHLPENLHLVLITRQDPPLPISRFRARGHVTEVRAGHLRFTSQEAQQFFNSQGMDLQPGWVQTLEERTEGWAVGLSLAALSMQGHENLEGFFQSFSGTHRYIFDYLIDEVMQQQPEALRTFLLKTSILDRFCAPLCDVILNQTDSQASLAQVERSNLFLIPLDDQRIWYRYHHLFADSLRANLEQGQPQEVVELHRRAAGWFEKKDLPDEAIQHALAAEDWNQAARLIESHGPAVIFERSAPSAFNAWFSNLPPETVEQHPALLPIKAWSEILLSNLKAAEYWINEAIVSGSQMDGTNETARRILGEAYTAGATLGVLTGNGEMVARYAQPALEMLPPKALHMRCIAQWCLGQDYRFKQELANSERAFAEAARLSKSAGLRFFHLLSFSSQGDRLVEMGRLREAARVYQEIQQFSGPGSPPLPPIAGEILQYYGALLLEWNRLDEAYDMIQQGLQLSRQTGIKEFILSGYQQLARAQMARQDVDGALATIQEGIEFAEAYQVHFRLLHLQALQARLWLLAALRGDQAKYQALASDWARATRVILDQPYDRIQLITYLTLARVDILELRYDECAEILEVVQNEAERIGQENSWVNAQVLKAWLLESQGKRGEALVAVQQAMIKAKPEGYVRVFLDAGPVMGTLLRAFSNVPAGAPFADYLHMLLLAFEKEGYASVQPAEDHTAQRNPPAGGLLIEPLNDRELEILRLMAQGLSNKEIAERLYLSTKTIKWHAYNLYSKLSVNSRTQAIAAAHEQSLL